MYKNLRNGCWINLPPQYLIIEGNFQQCPPPAHIHLKEGATPKAKHNPIPVPYHNKEEVKKAPWDNVKRGIIALIPIGTPTDWRRTYGYYCKEKWATKENGGLPTSIFPVQTENTPHQLTIQTVNANTTKHKKMVLDAVDGYHSIPLDEESQPLITFITEWGCFMYFRMPQG